ncbi:MAG: PQQ-dependent sugar dehydrogenase [Woeseia sp.]
MRPGIRKALIVTVTTLLAAPTAFAQSARPVEQGEPNVPEFEAAFSEQARAPASDSGVKLAVETFAEPLENPWGIDVLPDGGYVVTERPGRMRVISENGEISEPVAGIPEVLAGGQGGLLDVAVGPTFAKERLIYWTYARPLEGGKSVTVASCGRLSEDRSKFTDVEDVFVQEPPSPTPAHYGSRIVFDRDGHVFITTGDHFTAAERVLAQDLGTTYGKVIRVNLDGSIPEDNPVANQDGAIGSIWTLGHRNIQGATLHPETGRLWTIEHGPKGGDELNLSEPGANYGWPVVSYGENYDESPVGEGVERHGGDFVEPRYYWDPVIAPGGMLFYQGDLFGNWRGDLLISSMMPGALVRIELDGDTVKGEERLLKDHGRIRDIVEAPDGALLVLVDAGAGAVLRLTPDQSAAVDEPQEAWQAEGFDRPESVIFDNARNVLYVSNAGEDEKSGQGYISRLTPDGEVIEAQWVTGLKGPKGMAVHDDRLIVVDLEEGVIAETYDAPDAEFLNDLDGIESDDKGNYLVTDWVAGALYRVQPSGEAEQLLDLNQGSADLEYRGGQVLIPMMMDGVLRAWRVD